MAVVRVRDPFGALTRERLVEVLTRCAHTDEMPIDLDGSMGGAGLGLWQVATAASVFAISVVKDHHTEILIGVETRPTKPAPFAFHLFFRGGARRRIWKTVDEETGPASDTASITVTELGD
jgi:hypothetical protein